MVQLLPGFPDHVVAYEAKGHVDENEYRSIVMKRVDEVAARYGKIDFLVLLKTDFESYSLAAFMDYIIISFKHLSKWNRMAIVTDEDWVRRAYIVLSLFVPGEIRGYRLEEAEEARVWVLDAHGKDVNEANLLTSSLTATSAMTAYSYGMATMKGTNFKEPLLLGEMIRRPSGLKRTSSHIGGWLLHYAAGYGWTWLYRYALQHRYIRKTPGTMAVAGILSGLVAAVAWETLFKIHPRPPKNNRHSYYRHLIAAHVVFAIVALTRIREVK